MRILLTIAYAGTNYHGWQVQDNAITVQETFQNALEKTLSFRPDVTGCGRTDSGVHALKYCCHIDVPEKKFNIPVDRLPLAMNQHLPDDIRVYSAEAVDDEFHARYSVKTKTYRYRILNRRHKNPFYSAYTCHEPQKLDVLAMSDAAKAFVGEHDFSGFCSAGSKIKDTVRNVMCCSVTGRDDIIELTITAEGFLYNMVRIIAGTLIEVGKGTIPAEDIPGILSSRRRDAAGSTAPPQGLFLSDIIYKVK